MMKKNILLSIFLFMTAAVATAQTNPREFTFSGRLMDATGTNPNLSNNVEITVRIAGANSGCGLYEERQTVNLSSSNGYFTIGVGSGVGAVKRTVNDPGHLMTNIFRNSGAALAGIGCTHTPAVGEDRQLIVQVNDLNTGIIETLSPAQIIKSTPTALIAENAEMVGGVAAANILRDNTAGIYVLNQSNLENIFTATNYSALTSLLAGSSTLYNRPAANGTNALPIISSPSSPIAGQIWYNAGDILYYDGSATRTISTGGSGVTTFNGRAGAVVPATNDYTWAQINKSTSSLADLTTRSASDLNAGTIAPARLPTDVPFRSANNTFSGSNTFSVGNQVIDTGAPANTGLTIRGASGQTVPLQSWQNSGGTQLFGVNPNGGIRIASSVLPGSPAIGDLIIDASDSNKLKYYDGAWQTLGSGVGSGDFMADGSVPMTGTLQASSGVALSNGTAAVPSLTFAGNPTTGIYRFGADTIGFTAAGVQRAAISNTQMQVLVPLQLFSSTNPGTYNSSGSGSAPPNFGSNIMMSAAANNMMAAQVFMPANASINYQRAYIGAVSNAGAGVYTPEFVIGHQTAASNYQERFRISSSGNVGVGLTAPTAALHLKAGTATAGTAPLKLSSGANLTTPEAGAIEFDGTNLYYTDDTNTRLVLSTDNPNLNNISSISNVSGNILLSPQSTTGFVNINSGTPSINPTTGALVVTGGLGVSGSVNASSLSLTTSALTPQIYGSSAGGGTLRVDGTSHATKGNVFINSTGGNVGIGTSLPTYTLEVVGTGIKFSRHTDDNFAAPLISSKSRGTASFPTAVNNGDALLDVRAFGHDGTSSMIASRILSEVDLTPSAGIVPGRMSFYTTSPVGTSTERMRIDSNGNIGIGNAAPSVKLHVNGAIAIGGTGAEICAGTPHAGRLRYNIGNIEFCNGSNWQTLTAGGGALPMGGDLAGTTTNAQLIADSVTSAEILDATIGTTDIANSAITLSKMANLSAGQLIGRSMAGMGTPEAINVGAGLTFTGTTLELTDTTDDDSFAPLTGACPQYRTIVRNGSGGWDCALIDNLMSSNSIVKRDGAGNIEGAQITANSLRLNNAGSYVSINNPLGAGYALTLPNDDGNSGQYLQTDGSGVLTWANPPALPSTLLFDAGTAATPGLAVSTDTSTGFYRPGTGILGFSSSGTEAMRLTSNGLISSVTNSYMVRNSAGTSAQPTYTFNGSTDVGMYRPAPNSLAFATNAIERIRIDSNGNVGMGTTAPSTNLEVRANDANTGLIVGTSAGGSPRFPFMQVDNFHNGYGGYPSMKLQNSGGTSASPVGMGSGQYLGSIGFYGRGSASYYNSASIDAIATNNFSGSTAATELVFSTTPAGSTTAIPRTKIADNGDILLVNTSGTQGIRSTTSSVAFSTTAGSMTLSSSAGLGLSTSGAISAINLSTTGTGSNINLVPSATGKIVMNTAASAGFAKMGTCITSGGTTITNTWTTVTCTDTPASSTYAVYCSGLAADNAGVVVTCRGNGTASQISCQSSSGTPTAAGRTCMWMLP